MPELQRRQARQRTESEHGGPRQPICARHDHELLALGLESGALQPGALDGIAAGQPLLDAGLGDEPQLAGRRAVRGSADGIEEKVHGRVPVHEGGSEAPVYWSGLFAVRLTMPGLLCCYPHSAFPAITCRRRMKSSRDTSLVTDTVSVEAGLLLASLTLLPLRRCGAPG